MDRAAAKRFRLVPAASRKSAALVRAELGRAVAQAGASGVPVCLHSSLSAHGHVEGGAAAIVDAFLAEVSTLLVPTFTEETCSVLPAPAGDRPPRNGIDYTDATSLVPEAPYDAATAGIDPWMGAVAREVLGRPNRWRGDHPTCSFSAIGVGSKTLVAGQAPGDVFAPLRELAERGGVVVLAGVGLERMTLLHLAEVVAGRAPLRRWALAGPGEGEVVAVQTGGCSQGFPALAPALSAVERSVEVGATRWRAFPAAEAVEIAAAAIRESPEVTRCGDPGCLRCPDSIAGGPP